MADGVLKLLWQGAYASILWPAGGILEYPVASTAPYPDGKRYTPTFYGGGTIQSPLGKGFFSRLHANSPSLMAPVLRHAEPQTIGQHSLIASPDIGFVRFGQYFSLQCFWDCRACEFEAANAASGTYRTHPFNYFHIDDCASCWIAVNQHVSTRRHIHICELCRHVWIKEIIALVEMIDLMTGQRTTWQDFVSFRDVHRAAFDNYLASVPLNQLVNHLGLRLTLAPSVPAT